MDNCAVEATWLSFPSGLDYPRRRKTGVLRPNHRLQHSPDERRQNAALMPQGRSHWVSRIVTLGCSGPGSGHRHPYRTHVAALLCPRRIGLFDRGSRPACSPRRSDTGAPSPCGASNGSSTPGWPGAWLCPEALRRVPDTPRRRPARDAVSQLAAVLCLCLVRHITRPGSFDGADRPGQSRRLGLAIVHVATKVDALHKSLQSAIKISLSGLRLKGG